MIKTGKNSPSQPCKVSDAPPPTLAKKLGITRDTKIKLIGAVDDEALVSALAEGQIAPRGKPDVIIARVSTRTELEGAFERALKLVLEGAHLWIVYRKGKGHAINENDVRDTGLAAGIVDVKIAYVSELLTGLKFVRRRTAQSRARAV